MPHEVEEVMRYDCQPPSPSAPALMVDRISTRKLLPAALDPPRAIVADFG
jgi:hypothetical protein